MTFLSRLKETQTKSPHLWLLASFAAAITLGAILLLLPWAQNQAFPRLSVIDAIFTATSATCVTGLTTVCVCERFTAFGKCVILTLIQLGGLGIMTFAAFCIQIAGRRLSTKDESIFSLSAGGSTNFTFRGLLRLTFIFTFAIETIGAAILYNRFQFCGYSPANALFFGIFHAISAFCNAGISLFKDSLCSFSSDTIVSMTMLALMWLGGIGFLVIGNVFHIRFWSRDLKKRGRINLQSRIALGTSLILTLAFLVLFILLEWHHSLAKLDTCPKIISAVFQSITCRTSGFNMVDMTTLSMPTRFLTMAMIFVGGAPGSTAGGIKTTTLAVLLLTMWSFIRRQPETVLRNRTIPGSTVREALAICMLTLIFIGFIFGVLLITESEAGSDPFSLLFETFSACGTSGLSLGATGNLTTPGRALIIAAMFFGRIGPLTIAFCVGRSNSLIRIRYPEENVAVG